MKNTSTTAQGTFSKASFDIDMSFSPAQIAAMLKEYEADHHTGMDVAAVAEAVNTILKMNTPLFDSMVKQLDTYKDMRNMIEEILYQGKSFHSIRT